MVGAVYEEDHKVLWVLIFAFLFFFVGLSESWLMGYRVGQINAISEKSIEYELVKQDNGSVKWEKITNEKD
jgi:hypothetical protein